MIRSIIDESKDEHYDPVVGKNFRKIATTFTAFRAFNNKRVFVREEDW